MSARAAVEYHIEGDAGSQAFARAERIGEVLVRALGSMRVESRGHHPAEWPGAFRGIAERMRQRAGTTTPEVLVWTGGGVVVGEGDEFERTVLHKYGRVWAESEVGEERVRGIARENLQRAELEYQRRGEEERERDERSKRETAGRRSAWIHRLGERLVKEVGPASRAICVRLREVRASTVPLARASSELRALVDELERRVREEFERKQREAAEKAGLQEAQAAPSDQEKSQDLKKGDEPAPEGAAGTPAASRPTTTTILKRPGVSRQGQEGLTEGEEKVQRPAAHVRIDPNVQVQTFVADDSDGESDTGTDDGKKSSGRAKDSPLISSSSSDDSDKADEDDSDKSGGEESSKPPVAKTKRYFMKLEVGKLKTASKVGKRLPIAEMTSFVEDVLALGGMAAEVEGGWEASKWFSWSQLAKSSFSYLLEECKETESIQERLLKLIDDGMDVASKIPSPPHPQAPAAPGAAPQQAPEPGQGAEAIATSGIAEPRAPEEAKPAASESSVTGPDPAGSAPAAPVSVAETTPCAVGASAALGVVPGPQDETESEDCKHLEALRSVPEDLHSLIKQLVDHLAEMTSSASRLHHSIVTEAAEALACADS